MAARAALVEPALSARWVVGLGCRRGCTLAELRELLRQTLDELGLQASDLACLASSTHKQGEPGLQQLAEHLRLPLVLLPAEQLGAYHERLSGHSRLALHLTGSAGVAESSALAQAEALRGGHAELLCTKRRSASATLAIA
jgi:cobalt-precorrin 5A hydrolase